MFRNSSREQPLPMYFFSYVTMAIIFVLITCSKENVCVSVGQEDVCVSFLWFYSLNVPSELYSWVFIMHLFPQIQEGMVVYVCFLQGATEDIIQDMGKMSFSSARYYCCRTVL